MLVTDPTYIAAKQVKAGTLVPSLAFRLLADDLLQQYQVKLLTGDIYYEPVVKTLSPALRLIFDEPFDVEQLPIRKEQRHLLIGDVFRKIVREHRIDQYADFVKGEFRVQYLPYEWLFFQEMQSEVKHAEIIQRVGDGDIIEMHRFGKTYYALYANAEVLKQKKAQGQSVKIEQAVIQLIQERGYSGQYAEGIVVILDERKSVERVGGWYNYMR